MHVIFKCTSNIIILILSLLFYLSSPYESKVLLGDLFHQITISPLFAQCCYFFTVPSSPPIHVSLNPESSTSLRLQWSHVPNADKNGIIINYKINVTQDSSSHSFLLTYNGASSQHYLVQNLLKWTSYTLMIAASTVKGTSVYSPPVISRTLQDSKSIKYSFQFTYLCVLCCIFDFERSGNQRQGSQFFLGKWNS